jgi:Na+/phosphate symporter
MLIALFPVLMIVVGALMYALSANPKLAELGRLLFLAGSIGIAVGFATKMVSLF